jgi:ribosome-binding factor A
MGQRIDRIDELLRQEISSLLARDVADPRIGFVTVTRVDTAPDLAHARVWVSLIGQPAERTTTLAALRRAMPFVRRELGARLRLRRIPELHVEIDETVERGTRVLQLLHELEAGRVPDELPPPGESLPTPAPLPPADGPARAVRRGRVRPEAGEPRGARPGSTQGGIAGSTRGGSRRGPRERR